MQVLCLIRYLDADSFLLVYSFLAYFLSMGKNHRITVHAFDALAEKMKHGAGPQDTQLGQTDASAMTIFQQVLIVFCV